jgi:hypothetical protein
MDWRDVGKEQYDDAVNKIRELHTQEMNLLKAPSWDESRTDQLVKIQDGIQQQVQRLQELGINRDVSDILIRLLGAVPEDLRRVTGKLEGESDSIYWGEPRKFRLLLDYLPKVDYWIVWSFEPNRSDEGPGIPSATPVRTTELTLDPDFWGFYDIYGGTSDPEVLLNQGNQISIIAKLYLGSQYEPVQAFTTKMM